jgi:hypothetical protein
MQVGKTLGLSHTQAFEQPENQQRGQALGGWWQVKYLHPWQLEHQRRDGTSAIGMQVGQGHRAAYPG